MKLCELSEADKFNILSALKFEIAELERLYGGCEDAYSKTFFESRLESMKKTKLLFEGNWDINETL